MLAAWNKVFCMLTGSITDWSQWGNGLLLFSMALTKACFLPPFSQKTHRSSYPAFFLKFHTRPALTCTSVLCETNFSHAHHVPHHWFTTPWEVPQCWFSILMKNLRRFSFFSSSTPRVLLAEKVTSLWSAALAVSKVWERSRSWGKIWSGSMLCALSSQGPCWIRFFEW